MSKPLLISNKFDVKGFKYSKIPPAILIRSSSL